MPKIAGLVGSTKNFLISLQIRLQADLENSSVALGVLLQEPRAEVTVGAPEFPDFPIDLSMQSRPGGMVAITGTLRYPSRLAGFVAYLKRESRYQDKQSDFDPKPFT